jgi:diguanylate cyclase (GGDEF)-like protein/PAS domain S-box-containing protein
MKRYLQQFVELFSIPFFGIGLLYFTLGILALEFATSDGNVTIIWPSAGIALAAIIYYGCIAAIAVFLATFALGVYVDHPIWVSVLIAIGNTAAPLIATYLLKKFHFSKTLLHLRDYLSLVTIGGITSVVSAVTGISAICLSGIIPINFFYSSVTSWWMGHVHGILLLAPVTLLLLQKTRNSIFNKPNEFALLLTVCTVIAIGIYDDVTLAFFSIDKSYSFLIIIPFAWSILRFDHVITSSLLVLCFFTAVWGLLNHNGLFYRGDIHHDINHLWQYFIVVSAVSMILSYISKQRNTLFEAFDNSQTETYIFTVLDAPFEFINRAAREKLNLNLTSALKLKPNDINPLLTNKVFTDAYEKIKANHCKQISIELDNKALSGYDYPVEIHLNYTQQQGLAFFIASVYDISQRKQQETQVLLGNSVCDHTYQAVMITDKNNIILRVNPAFTRITGYSEQEALGNTPNILKSGRHDEQFYQLIWDSIEKNGEWSGEIYNRNKNGTLYLEKLFIKVIKTSNGDVENYVAVFEDITKLKEQEQQLKHFAEYDILTGLANKYRLNEVFLSIKATAVRHQTQFALLFIDLNDFKPINDEFGHLVGDQVLYQIAQRLHDSIREVDLAARVGGDEFVIILTEVKDENDVTQFIAKIKQQIHDRIKIGQHGHTLSASIGYALYPRDAESLERLLSIADDAMYEDKRATKSN